MSPESAEIVRGVRIPLAGHETRRHRTLDERIVVRFPSVARRLSAAWARLPRHSRLRRAMLARRLRQTYAAANRRDFDFLLTGLLDPGIEYHTPVQGPGWDPIYRGHEGYREIWRVLLEAFEDLRLDPEELLDLGDRWLVTVELSMHGAGSGAPHSQRLFQLFTLRRGLVLRQDDFFDRAEALETLELSE